MWSVEDGHECNRPASDSLWLRRGEWIRSVGELRGAWSASAELVGAPSGWGSGEYVPDDGANQLNIRLCLDPTLADSASGWVAGAPRMNVTVEWRGWRSNWNAVTVKWTAWRSNWKAVTVSLLLYCSLWLRLAPRMGVTHLRWQATCLMFSDSKCLLSSRNGHCAVWSLHVM